MGLKQCLPTKKTLTETAGVFKIVVDIVEL